jgi:heterodisulfide reductase subunit B2
VKEKLTYAYFPGCSLESTASEYDLSVKAVSSRLGIELVGIPDWNCCGASAVHSTNQQLAHALVGRNLALAEKANLDMMVACPACYLRFRTTYWTVKAEPGQQKKIEELTGMPYRATYQIRHLLDIIFNEVGLDKVRKLVSKPLKKLKVVCYYGCYLVRPPKVAAFDDPENPQVMDKILTALGAEVKDWSGKVDCCAGSLSISKAAIAGKLVGDIIEMARKAEAEAIVTACPLCQSNLETRQGSRQSKLPIIYFTELMGLAMGLPDTKLWMKKHLISPLHLLSAHGL